MKTRIHSFILNLWNNWTCLFGVAWWNPLHALEIRRSIKIDLKHPKDEPLISIIIALLFVRFEWYLGKDFLLIEGEKDENSTIWGQGGN